jgi:hypothetical protein
MSDLRTPAEIRYDLERSGELYIKPGLPAEVASGEMSALRYAARLLDQAIAEHRAAYVKPADDDEEEDEAEIVDTPIPMGTIADCAVTGLYRDDGSLFEAKLSWNGLLISVLGSTDIINVDGFDIADCIGDMTFAMWGKVKALAHTDVVEQLMALARSHQSPPTSTPAVTVERFVCDDELDRRRGQELGISYACGSSWIYFPHDGSRPGIRTFDADITTDLVDRHLDELIALLNDPRVQALRRGQ